MSCSLPQLRHENTDGSYGFVGIACKGATDLPVRHRSLRHRARGSESEPTLLKLPQVVPDSRARIGAHQSGKGGSVLTRDDALTDNRRRGAYGNNTEITRDDIVPDGRRPAWWPGYGEVNRGRRSLKIVVRSSQKQDFAAAIERHDNQSERIGPMACPSALEKRLNAAYIQPFQESKAVSSSCAPKSQIHPAVSSTAKVPVVRSESSPIEDWARTSAAHHEWVKDLFSGAQKERAANKRLAPVLDAATAAEQLAQLVTLHSPEKAPDSLEVAAKHEKLEKKLESPSKSLPSPQKNAPARGALEKLVERFGNHDVQEKIVVDSELASMNENTPADTQQATSCKDYITEREASRDKRCLHAFRSFSEAGEIDSDHLEAALMLLGYMKPCKAWIEEAAIEASRHGILENRPYTRAPTLMSMNTNEEDDGSPHHRIKLETKAVSFLDCHDFSKFVKGYEKRHYARLRESFESSCLNDEGMLRIEDLEPILKELGMPPMPGAFVEIVEDAAKADLANACGCEAEFVVDALDCRQGGQNEVSYVDENHAPEFPEHVHFPLFARICDLCGRRAGMDRSHYETMSELFKRYCLSSGDPEASTQSSGDTRSVDWLDEEGLQRILNMDVSHCVQSEEDDDDTLSEIERNGGRFNLGEFLYAMRWRMEAGITRLRDAFSGVDATGLGVLRFECMPALFESLGFATASPTILQETARTAGVSREQLDFDGVWQLLKVFNRQCGLSLDDVEDAKNIFHRCDEDSSGGINGSELRYVFHKMGFPSTYEMLQEIKEEFDLDSSGELELRELMRLVARYREREMLSIRKTFNRICRETQLSSVSCSMASGFSAPRRGPRLSMNIVFRDLLREDSGLKADRIKLSDLRTVLHSLGYTPSKEQELALLRNLDYDVTELEFWQVAGLVEHFRSWAKDEFQQNCGFTEVQLDAIRTKFESYDTDNVGLIRHNKVASMLRDLHPDMVVDQSARDLGKMLLNIGGVNEKGYLDLPGYIRIMRHYQDRREYDRLQEESEVMTSLNFSRKDVIELRQIFKMFDTNTSGELEDQELAVMLKPILPGIGGMLLEDLRSLLSEVDKDGNRNLNFVEFMTFIRKLQEKDLHGINQKSKTISFELGSQS